MTVRTGGLLCILVSVQSHSQSRRNLFTLISSGLVCKAGLAMPLVHEVYCMCIHACSTKASFVIKVSNGDTSYKRAQGKASKPLSVWYCFRTCLFSSRGASLLSLALFLSPSLSPFSAHFLLLWFPRDQCGNNRCTINVGQARESKRLIFLLSGLLAEGRKAMFGCVQALLCVFLVSEALAPRLLKFRP